MRCQASIIRHTKYETSASMFLFRIAPNLYRDLCPFHRRVSDTSYTQHRHRRHHEQIRRFILEHFLFYEHPRLHQRQHNLLAFL